MRRLPQLVLLAWLALALAAPLMPLHPWQIDLQTLLAPPGAGHWLGTDDLGRPVLDRLLLGARVSLLVAACVVGVSLFIGVLAGSLAAWYGGLAERALTAVLDLFMAFPGILLAIALAGILGPGLDKLVIALSVVGWVGYARLARAQVLSVKQREHVLAARSLGTPLARIMTRHLLPLMAAPLVVETSFGLAAVVVAEAGLSFLGLGLQVPHASWGGMIRDGVRYLLVAPHLVLAPGLALMLVVFSLNVLGDRLRDRLDVRMTDRTGIEPT